MKRSSSKISSTPDKLRDFVYNCGLFRQSAVFGAFALLTFEEIHMSLPHCPKCNSEYTYEDNGMYICPECAYEWNDAEPAQESDELIVKDANGNLLADGDSVTIIKDLKVKVALRC